MSAAERPAGERPLPPTGKAEPQIAVVTGAAKRIGRAIALDLARHGWRVAITWHSSADEAAQTVRDIEAAGTRGLAIHADLTDEAQVEAVMPQAAEGLGGAGVAAGQQRLGLPHGHGGDGDPGQLGRASGDQSARAPGADPGPGAAAAGGLAGQRDQHARPAGVEPDPYFLSYTVAKIGLWTLTRTLAQALAPKIRVNGIGPGPTLKSDRQSEEHFAQQWDAVPLRRSTSPQEICDAIRFILSAPAMTGQMIALDGGEHLGWAQPSRGIVPLE